MGFYGNLGPAMGRSPLWHTMGGRGLAAETLAWMGRNDRVDPAWYNSAVDRFIRRGLDVGWYQRLGEIVIMGSETRQASLNGLKGVITEAACKFPGLLLRHTHLGSVSADASGSFFAFTIGNPTEFGLHVGQVFHLVGTAQNPDTAFTITGFMGTEDREVIVTPAPADMVADTNWSLNADGDFSFLPRFGAMRTSVAQNSYIDTGKHLTDFGCTIDSAFIGVYCTTNYVGPYAEAGVAGSASAVPPSAPLQIRAGSGFRSGVWLFGDQMIFGNGQVWGWTAASRNGPRACTSWRRTTPTPHDAPAKFPDMPTGTVSILSSEPSVANSPNRVLIFAIGPGLPDEMAADLAAAVDDFTTYIGIFSEIEVPAIDTRTPPHTFGADALSLLATPGFRCFRQNNWPATNQDSVWETMTHPITDCIGRSYLAGTRTFRMTVPSDEVPDPPFQPNAFSTQADSQEVTVEIKRHGLEVGDVVTWSLVLPVGGFAQSEFASRFRVKEVIDADHIMYEMPRNAETTEVGGGDEAAVFINVMGRIRTKYQLQPGWRHWHLAWSNRGRKRLLTDTADATPILKGNDTYGAIRRLSALVDEDTEEVLLQAGTECRTQFSTRRGGGLAMLAQIAHVLGAPERGPWSLVEGGPTYPRGYLDILDLGVTEGLHSSRCITNLEALTRADEIFDNPLVGYATSTDWTILAERRLVHDTPDFDRDQVGIAIDYEHADGREPEINREIMLGALDICAAAGAKLSVFGHFPVSQWAVKNGLSRDHAWELMAHPALECWNITPAKNQSTAAPILPGTTDSRSLAPFLETQLVMWTGPDGDKPIDWSKLLVAIPLMPGKELIDDTAPFAPTQPDLFQCDEIADWMQFPEKRLSALAKSGGVITKSQTVRGGMPEGGPPNRVPNQQTMHYWRNLAPATLVTPESQVNAFNLQVVAHGGPALPAAWRTAMVDLIAGMITDGNWHRLDRLWLLANHSSVASYGCLRSRAWAEAAAPPEWTQTTGVTFGSDTFISTGFIPAEFTNAFLPNDHTLGVWIDNQADDGAAIGTELASKWWLNPRASTDMREAQSSGELISQAVADCTGLTTVGRVNGGHPFFQLNDEVGASTGDASPYDEDLPDSQIQLGRHTDGATRNCTMRAAFVAGGLEASRRTNIGLRLAAFFAAIEAIPPE